MTITINIITYYDYVRESGSLSSSSSFSFYHTNKEVFITLIDTLIRMIASCWRAMEMKFEREMKKMGRIRGREKESASKREKGRERR